VLQTLAPHFAVHVPVQPVQPEHALLHDVLQVVLHVPEHVPVQLVPHPEHDEPVAVPAHVPPHDEEQEDPVQIELTLADVPDERVQPLLQPPVQLEPHARHVEALLLLLPEELDAQVVSHVEHDPRPVFVVVPIEVDAQVCVQVPVHPVQPVVQCQHAPEHCAPHVFAHITLHLVLHVPVQVPLHPAVCVDPPDALEHPLLQDSPVQSEPIFAFIAALLSQVAIIPIEYHLGFI
jgi:hypothetical protein